MQAEFISFIEAVNLAIPQKDLSLMRLSLSTGNTLKKGSVKDLPS